MPVFIGVLWPSRREALACPRGDIRLSFCPRCGFIHNRAFDPGRLDYGQAYDNSLHFSPVYQDYARATAQGLVQRYGLTGKTVVEIGCGKGDFLLLLCSLGNNRGIGFDQSYEERPLAPELAERVTFINDYYGAEYADYRSDLICSRYVLEHIPDPVGFMKMVRSTISDGASPVIYFEVPNVGLILSQLSVWDIIYEHCSYFSLSSLARVFEESGFRVLAGREGFSGQFISLEAQPGSRPSLWPGRSEESPQRLAAEVASFPAHYRAMVERWSNTLRRVARDGKRVVLWGGGAKGVSFLNMLQVESEIEYVVDINPGKQGKFIAGTGQQIVSPAFLRDYVPETVIILNPAYRTEIGEMLHREGLSPEILCP